MEGMRREGWAQLDGLLSGNLVDGDASFAVIEDWARERTREGTRFSLHRDGGRFSVLADDQPLAAGQAGLRAGLTVALEELLQSMRLGAGQWESTLRLRQWSSGEETQVLWVPDAAGALTTLDRSVACETHAGAASSRALWLKPVLVSLGLLAFVLWSLVQTGYVFGTHWSGIRLEAGVYAQHVRLETRAERLHLELILPPDELRQAWARAEPGTTEAFLLEDLLRGHVRYRFLDSAGKALPGAWTDVALHAGSAVIDQAPPRGAAALVLEL